MANFSATDAALEGFRVARRNPKAIGIWALLALVFNFAIISVMIVISGPALTEMTAASRSGANADPAQSLEMLGAVMGGYAAMIPLALLYLAVFSAAIYRALARPQDSAFGFVRLGADELRLLVVSVVVGLLGMVGIFAISLVLGLIGGGLGAAMSGGGGQVNFGLVVLGVILLYGVIIFASMAFYVKFSFAGPMTFIHRRIDIFGSWKATQGRFWSLFGCYLLAIVLGVVVSLLGAVIGMAALVGLGGGVSSVMMPDMSSMGAYFTPGMIAYLAVNSIFTGLTYAIYQAPAMSAYQSIHGVGADISKTFE